MARPTQLLVDTRDQRSYSTVRIGRQLWMGENFAYMPTVCPADSPGSVWVFDYEGNDVDEARQSRNYLHYGCLYTLEAATEYCPPGWRLPKMADFEELAGVLGRFGPELSKRLIEGGDSGFNACLGGYRSGPCLKHMPWGAKGVLGEFRLLDNSFHCLLDRRFTGTTHDRDERVATFYFFKNYGGPVGTCSFSSVNVKGAASVRFISTTPESAATPPAEVRSGATATSPGKKSGGLLRRLFGG